MRILELHASCFHVPWRREHDVLTWGFGPRVDVRTGPQPLDIGELLDRLPGGWRPDLIVLGEDGPLLRVLGLEDPPCPIVMLAVDHRGHLAWQAQLARAMDVVCVGRRDALPAFFGAPVEWCPPWAPDGLPEPTGERSHPVVVVGAPVVDDSTGLVGELARRVSIRFAEGPSASLFSQTRIVVRHPKAGPLDARTLQAMACGALVVAERSGGGLLELFEDGREVVTTTRGDALGLASRVCRLLEDESTRAAIAERGRQAVRERHLRSHRAETVLAHAMAAGGRAAVAVRNAAAARAYCQLGEHARLLPPDSPYAVPPETYFSSAARLALAAEMLEPDRRAVFARIALAAGDCAQAVRHLDMAVAGGGALEDHLLRVETLVRAGELRRARAAADILRTTHPDEPSTAATLARLGGTPVRGLPRVPRWRAARHALDLVARNVQQVGRAFIGMAIPAPAEPTPELTLKPFEGCALDLGAGRPAERAICVRPELEPGVHVVAAAEALPFSDGVFDVVSSRAQLSRVADPSRVAAEITRVLRPGGRAVVSVPFLQAAANDGGDLYRFTPAGLAGLFRDLEPVNAGSAAGPATVLGELLQAYMDALPASGVARLLGEAVAFVAATALAPLRWVDGAVGDTGWQRTAHSLYLVVEKQAAAVPP